MRISWSTFVSYDMAIVEPGRYSEAPHPASQARPPSALRLRRGLIGRILRRGHRDRQPSEQLVTILGVEAEFGRARRNPGRILGTLSAAAKKFLIPGGDHVNVAHVVTAGIPD